LKILLVNAPPLKRVGVIELLYPPLGILYLAAYIRHKYEPADIQAIDGYHESGISAVVNKISSFAPDVLGVSFTTQAATGAYEVINSVGAKRKIPLVVAGGAHPTVCATEVLTRSQTDVVVMGEGEETFLELITRFANNKNWKDILGIAYSQAGRVTVTNPRPLINDLDSVPFPARDLLPIKQYPGYHYKKTTWDTSYLSSRGCPYQCVFCCNAVWKYQKPWFRVRSPKNIADEIEYLKKTYGAREFCDMSDLFNGDTHWAKNVCDEFVSRHLDVCWKAEMTVQNIDDELAEKMARAGCWISVLGIETGNDTTLEGINKRARRETTERALGILKRHKVKTFGFFMAFNVWEKNGKLMYENRTAMENTLNFAWGLVNKGLLDLMSFSLTTPYPGSLLYKIAKRHKLIPDNMEGRWELWHHGENFIMNLPGITEKEWRAVKARAELLQALLLIKSGAFSISLISLYFRKLVLCIKNMLFLKRVQRRNANLS